MTKENITVETAAAIMARASSNLQEERSSHYTTTEAQHDACLHQAQIDGYTKFNFYSDTESGRKKANIKRDDFRRMMEDAKGGLFSVLYVTELSRISRDVITLMTTLESLDSYGVKVIALRDPDADDSPTGKFMRVLKAGLNALESDTISARVRAKANEKAKKGLNNGGVLFGYQCDEPGNPRTHDPKRAPVIQMIYEKSAKGLTPHEIALELNESELVPRIKKEFRGDQIKSWLTNSFYKGEYPKGQKGAHEAIVPADLWEAAQPKDQKKKT